MAIVALSSFYKWASTHFYVGYYNHEFVVENFEEALHRHTFAGEPLPFDNPQALKKFEKELKRKTKTSKSKIALLRRAAFWLPKIEPILVERGIPSDFKYLAVVESNLTLAQSPRGAAGIWQITKPTAAALGLIVNDEIDERYNTIKSTYAASIFIKKAYRLLGNWTDAAAAYNYGINGMLRKKRKYRADSFYELSFNKETARYIYKILAVKEILENPEEHGFKSGYTPAGNPFRKITVTSTIPNLDRFADSLGIEPRQLRTLNPWLKKNTLTIPQGKAKKFIIKLPK